MDTSGEKPAKQSLEPAAASLFSMSASDPHQELIDYSAMAAEEVQEIDALMEALSRLRAAEKALSEASLRYMELGETDMRALHFVIVSENTGSEATPGAIARTLGISSASTTKLLDRLESAGHVRRLRHPTDRRALVVRVDPSTRATAMRTMGAQQARRVDAAKRLGSAERRIVTRFLEDMAADLSLEGVDWGDDPGIRRP